MKNFYKRTLSDKKSERVIWYFADGSIVALLVVLIDFLLYKLNPKSIAVIEFTWNQIVNFKLTLALEFIFFTVCVGLIFYLFYEAKYILYLKELKNNKNKH